MNNLYNDNKKNGDISVPLSNVSRHIILKYKMKNCMITTVTTIIIHF